MLRLLTVTLVLAAAVVPLRAQDAPFERPFNDLELVLSFPAAWQLKDRTDSRDPGVQGNWAGKLGASELRVRLVLIPRSQWRFEEPSQVVDMIGDDLANPQTGGNVTFHFDEITHVQGPYGLASYATLTHSTENDQQGEAWEVRRLGGLLSEWGYAVEARAKPALAAADSTAVKDALAKCIAYSGEARDPKWTDEEVKERWEASVPDDLKEEMEDVLRTPHYIIFTNSSGGKTFAKKMEECYTAIRKVFPFEEVPGRRLMPVFLFRTNDQYYGFLGKQLGWTVEQSKRTQGVAFEGLYTTWYEAPGDPVHVHEATHQIFRDRLQLDGGGSWFQEGVAEFMSSKENDRGNAARAVTKGKAMPLPELMRTPSLVFSSPEEDKSGEDVANNQYEYASLIIEFVHDSKWGKAKFQEWIHAVGAAPPNHIPAIQAAIQRVYGTDIAGFEKEFAKYCAKR